MLEGLQILNKHGKLAATLFAYNTFFWMCLLYVTRHDDIDLVYSTIISISLSFCSTCSSFFTYLFFRPKNLKESISEVLVIVGYLNTFLMAAIIALSFRYDTHFIFSLKIMFCVYATLLIVSLLVDIIKKRN